MIAVVDYGAGNVASVVHAFAAIGHPVTVVREPALLHDASAIVLPGVSAWGAAMCALHHGGFVEALTEAVMQKGTPYLGICLGMQLLGEASEETPGVPGLGWLPGGQVVRLRTAHVPHVGWNSVFDAGRQSRLLAGIEAPCFYFLHSYHLAGWHDKEAVCTVTEYEGETVTASVEAGHVWGIQFHGEKSSAPGLQVLRNFVAMSFRGDTQ